VSADVVTLEANNYRPRRERDVLAFRAYFRSANGNDLPFFLQSSFGGTSDLRGYESGRYRDDMMYAVQAEYRWRPREKWVFTGFVGLGAVASEFDGLFDDVLPAGGIGTRYMLSSAHNFSISADFAVGEGDRQFYFGVNEAF
jgi:hemolysin activation/secretion protein